jgi:hypothetical protein
MIQFGAYPSAPAVADGSAALAMTANTVVPARIDEQTKNEPPSC